MCLKPDKWTIFTYHRSSACLLLQKGVYPENASIFCVDLLKISVLLNLFVCLDSFLLLSFFFLSFFSFFFVLFRFCFVFCFCFDCFCLFGWLVVFTPKRQPFPKIGAFAASILKGQCNMQLYCLCTPFF